MMIIRPVQRTEILYHTTLSIIERGETENDDDRDNLDRRDGQGNSILLIILLRTIFGVLALFGVYVEMRNKERLVQDIVIEY